MKYYAVSSFILALTLTLTANSPSSAQGISEYGGVMGIPKPVPKPEAAVGALNSLYGLPGKVAGSAATAVDNAGGQSRQNAASVTSYPRKKNAKGAVIQSGDIPNGSAKATRQALIDQSRQASDLFKKGTDANAQGKSNEAEQFFKKSLAIREAYWRDTDKQIPDIQLKLGEIYANKGDLKKAETTLNQALISLSRFYGPGSDNRLKPLLLLSDVYNKEGDSAKSYENLKQAYQLATRSKDASIDPVPIMLQTGKMANGLHKYREAEELYEVALSDSHRGKLNHDQLLNAIDDYAVCLKGLNRERDAEFVLRQGKEIRESLAQNAGKTQAVPGGPDSGSAGGTPTTTQFVRP